MIAIGVACCIRKRKQREDEKNAMDHLWETNPTIQVFENFFFTFPNESFLYNNLITYFNSGRYEAVAVVNQLKTL